MVCLSCLVSALRQGPLSFSLPVLKVYAMFVERHTHCGGEMHRLNLRSGIASHFTLIFGKADGGIFRKILFNLFKHTIDKLIQCIFYLATDMQKDLLLNCCGSHNTSVTSSHTYRTQTRPLTVLLQSHLMLPGSIMHSPDLVNRTPTVTVVTKGDKGNTRRIVSVLYLCKCYNIRPHRTGLLDLP